MANEVDNSKELNEQKIKNEEDVISKVFMLTTLKSLVSLLNDVAILRAKVKYLTFSFIFLAVSFIFMNLLYWL